MAHYEVLSPDGFPINLEGYKSKKQANVGIEEFVKKYERQGYYSTVQNGERVQIPLGEIKQHCRIV